ncbi:protein 5NUC-like isoform X3 [Leguminivora glycinivorella]|uniref:protein 5NUC-like isoform X3 n=1 Tax=Leguminivora glycinivorella TaxID=1035111 RepID=UPI0020108D03|nr:protein 5NUC-like isoform X3 [Leguminivora glycinivorella]
MCFFIMEARDWCGLIFMNLPFIIALLATAALSSSTVIKSPETGAIPPNFELLILHNNDMHARFEQTSQLSGVCTTADREAGKCYGGFPRVATVVKEARRKAASGEGPPVLYLNAGDTYTGTAWFTIYKWKIAAEFINALRPDAVSLGNHELDNGVSGLTPFIANLTCPVLAANLILADEPALQAEHNLMNSIIFNVNGTKVGVIGYLTPDTKVLAIKNYVEYVEETVAIKQEVAKLKKEGVKILIALGHSGFAKDLEIAREVEDIDLVIGGHTNTFLWNGTTPDVEVAEGPYPTLVKQRSGRLVPAVQAYAYTKYLGKLHIVFNTEGEIVSYDGNPVLLNSSVPQDPEVLTIVNRYRGEVLKISEVVIGNSSVILDGHSCRLRECNLGNFITDAMVHKYASSYKGVGWTDAPIAIMQGGGIRTSIAHVDLPTVVTKGDLLTVMPFDGNTAKVTLNGTRVWNMLEHAVARYNPKRPPGQFLQMSGLRVEYDFRYPPGKRVVKVSVRCGMCPMPTYSVLNKTATYKILMPAFLSTGGDGFDMFYGRPSQPLVYGELAATIDFLNKTSPVYPATEGRILIHHEDKLKVNSAVAMSMSFYSIICAIFMLGLVQ